MPSGPYYPDIPTQLLNHFFFFLKKRNSPALDKSSFIHSFKADWKPIGCYRNVSRRETFALPELFDDKMSAKSPDAIFNYCKMKAEALGYKIFGADNKSCWSGDDAKNTYKKYGESKRCDFSKKTGNGSGKTINGDAFVYELA